MLRFSLIAAMVLALSACEGVKKQLGFTKQSPDEFKVVSRAPLSLPPDYNLRPPEPGIPRPQEGTTSQQAKNAIFRLQQPEAGTLEPKIESDDRSLAELSLLKAAGAGQADPNIRSLAKVSRRRGHSPRLARDQRRAYFLIYENYIREHRSPRGPQPEELAPA